MRTTAIAADESGVIDLATTASFTLGGLWVSPSTRQVRGPAGEALVEPRVLQVVVALAQAGEEVVSRDELVRRCWGGRIVGEDAVHRSIAKARHLANMTSPQAFVVETIPRVGYRLRVAEPAPPQPAPQQLPSQHPLSSDDVRYVTPAPARTAFAPWRRLRRPIAVAATLMLALAVGAVVGLRPRGGSAERLLLVSPLRVAPNDGAARGLGEGLSADLARMVMGNGGKLTVADPNDLSPRDAALADFTASGEAQTAGGVVNATLRLRGRRTAAILWSNSFSRPIGEVDELRRQIAAALADATVCALSGKNFPDDLDAETTRLFLGACEQKHGDRAQALKLLQQAVKRRPDLARGWGMLAAAYAWHFASAPEAEALGLRREAEAAAAHALRLDPHTGDAYYARAAILPGVGSWSRRMAILTAGQAADPDNSVLKQNLAVNLSQVGRLTEALHESRLAVETDPFSPTHAAEQISLLAAGGFALDAAAALKQAQQRWPGDRHIAEAGLNTLALTGDAKTAEALLNNPAASPTLPPEDRAVWTRVVQARLAPSPPGVEAAARAVMERASAPDADSAAAIQQLVVLGRLDDAYALAAHAAFSPRWPTPVLFSQMMAPFRADPRFMPLARRLGLTAVWQTSGAWPDFCTDRRAPYDCRAAAKASAPGRP